MDIGQLTVSKLKNTIRNAGITGKAAYEENEFRPVLLSFLVSLNDIISEVCRPFSSFGLLCALQHYLPIHIMKPQAGFEGDAQILFNNAAMLAFRFSSPVIDAKVKFTRADYQKIAETEDFSWTGDYSEVIGQIYYLVTVIDLFVKNLRWLGKGAAARVDLAANNISSIVNMQMPAELQEKVGEYDERLIRNQNILIRLAMPLGAIEPESPLNCVAVNPNWVEFNKGDKNPPPIPRIFGMDAIYTLASFHADEVIDIFNKRVHIEDLFVLLAALFKPLVEDVYDKKRFAGQGYSFVEEQHLIDYIVNWAPKLYADCFSQGAFPEGTAFVLESLSQSYWKEVAPPLLKFISHDFMSRESIDHLLFQPIKFAYRCDDGTVFLHLGSVAHFFAHFFDEFQKTGQFGDIKGKTFESLLINILESIMGFQRIWEPSRKLRLPVGKKKSTDVDVFVQRNELAFLISCKSYGINRRYELGEGQTCWGRSQDSKSWLHFTHETAQVIAKNCDELQLPKELRGIMPLVCIGWPDYLYEPSRDYFMEDGTPRIATIREIEQFCRSIDNNKATELLSDPWVVGVTND
jgi:hypothetical protein